MLETSIPWSRDGVGPSCEQGDAGGEAVQEVAAADRAELAGAEPTRGGNGSEKLLDHTGVVIGVAEESLGPVRCT